MVDTSDLLPKTPRYLKVPLIILNAILWILGLLLIILGGVAVSKFSNIKEMISISIPAGLIVIGVFFVILTIVGCFVAYKENLVGLVFYTVFMLVLLVCLIGVGGGALSYRNDVETPLHKAWSLSDNNTKNIIEDYFQCCAWDENENLTIGTKCLTSEPIPGNPVPIIVRTNPDGPYCKNTIIDFVQKYLYLAGAAGLTIGIIEFISMLFALFLIIRICNSPRSKSYD
ncbi:tetraspanin family protein [Tieghemostelium lacteum]|uniref:Tetraspanin family protein n=1 Tax=Tieghemostelium lacteum TaxID=361077 RepID=A0A151Z8C4_TIELA|nr:tetraspanin family protein [Tieghemostelium lacteum]|eukprot:KYQ90044.1 tetraspanin family protein [Tieghemostelium lacteum]